MAHQVNPKLTPKDTQTGSNRGPRGPRTGSPARAPAGNREEWRGKQMKRLHR